MNIEELLPELASFYNRKSKLLSGRQQEIVSIARTIFASPVDLLFDELLEGLARSMMIKISDIVEKMKAEGKDILCAESSLDKASLYADRIIRLDKGQIVATGTPAEIKRQMTWCHQGEIIDMAYPDWSDLKSRFTRSGSEIGGKGYLTR